MARIVHRLLELLDVFGFALHQLFNFLVGLMDLLLQQQLDLLLFVV